jgi:hypothetical protein
VSCFKVWGIKSLKFTQPNLIPRKGVMGLNKKLFGLMSVLLSAGLLFGCGDGGDEQEPDPTEEPTEQQEQNED